MMATPCSPQVQDQIRQNDALRWAPSVCKVIGTLFFAATAAVGTGTAFGRIKRGVGVPITVIGGLASLALGGGYLGVRIFVAPFGHRMEQEMGCTHATWPPTNLARLQHSLPFSRDVEALRSAIPSERPNLSAHPIPDLSFAMIKGESTAFDRQLIGQAECWAGAFLEGVAEESGLKRPIAASKVYYLLHAMQNPFLSVEYDEWADQLDSSALHNGAGPIPPLN